MNIDGKRMQAYTEISCILEKMPKYFVNKIPLKLLNKFKENRDYNYQFKYDDTKTLEDQNITKETKALLAVLKYNYWCKDNAEKDNYINQIKQNEIKEQNRLREQYNLDNLFKKKEIKEEKEESTELIEYKESNFFKRIINKLINFFRGK